MSTRELLLFLAISGGAAIAHLDASGQTIATNNSPRMFPSAYVVATSGPGSDGRVWANVFDADGSLERAQPLSSRATLGFALDETGTFGENIGQSTSPAIDFFQGNLNLNPGTPGINSLAANSCITSIAAPRSAILATDTESNALYTGPANSTPGMYPLEEAGSVPQTPIGVVGSSVVGSTTMGRFAVISQNLPYGVACNNIASSVTQTGSVTFYDQQTTSPGLGDIDSGSTVSIGRCPVFGVASSDGERAFVLNRGDDTVSVIDLLAARVDATVALNPSGGTHAGPVHAVYVSNYGKLLVANYDNDTVSVLNVQTDLTGADRPGFPAVTATIDLWNGAQPSARVCVLPGSATLTPCTKHPVAITVVADGSRAYVANQGTGTVDVIDLRLNQVVSSLPTSPGSLQSHQASYAYPRSLTTLSMSKSNSLFDQVFAGSPTSNFIAMIYAGDNVVVRGDGGLFTAAGNVTDIHISSPVPTDQVLNTDYSTRLPGAGQPCMLPDRINPKNLADCFAH